MAAMTGHRLLSGTDARLRIAPWRGDTTTAHLTPGRSPAHTGRDRPGARRARGRALRRRPHRGPPAGGAAPVPRGRLRGARAAAPARARPRRPPARSSRCQPTCAAVTTPTDPGSSPSTPPPSRRSGASTRPGLEDALAATPSARLRVGAGRGPRPADRRLRGHRASRSARLPAAARRRPARPGRGHRRGARRRRAALAAPLGRQGGAGEHPGGERRGRAPVRAARLPPPGRRAGRAAPVPRRGLLVRAPRRARAALLRPRSCSLPLTAADGAPPGRRPRGPASGDRAGRPDAGRRARGHLRRATVRLHRRARRRQRPDRRAPARPVALRAGPVDGRRGLAQRGVRRP